MVAVYGNKRAGLKAVQALFNEERAKLGRMNQELNARDELDFVETQPDRPHERVWYVQKTWYDIIDGVERKSTGDSDFVALTRWKTNV